MKSSKTLLFLLTTVCVINAIKAQNILSQLKIDPSIKAKDLADGEVNRIREVIEKEHRVEGDLRREVSMNIKRLMDLGTYRGLRHRRSLPVRGQRTHTNARTRKGPRRQAIALVKKVV